MIKKTHKIIFLLSVVTLVFLLVYIFFGNQLFHLTDSDNNIILLKQSRDIMKDYIDTIASEKRARKIKINEETDPNKTGLIGIEFSSITTTLGDLEAKRTSVNPDTAAMICSIFLEEGLNKGDTVAVGASSSFPGLLLATLAACKTLELNPVAIVSFGASQYGANDPEFPITEILKTLENKYGDLFKPAAVSFGGNDDIADDLSVEAREFIKKSIENSGYTLLYEEKLTENIEKRMEIYRKNAPTDIKMFVNIGGAITNIGTSPEILKIEPGLNKEIKNIPSSNERGVLYEFASKNVPVLHLLYMKGLSIKYGLVWDPIPFKDDSYKKIINLDNLEKQKYIIFFLSYIITLTLTALLTKLLVSN
ncbi:MAG: poly-gamma-glutamate system protein [Kosmotoga sp.]|nr:MAG: poly-gamma-glutamate system protein [Kosmotoga sp.]